MKQFLSILAVSLLLVFSGCQSGFQEQKFMGVNGNPKSVKVTSYKAVEKFGEVIGENAYSVSCYEFNELGQVQKASHGISDEITITTTNTFEDGKCIARKIFQKYDNKTVTNTLKNRTSTSEVWEATSTDGASETTTIVHEDLGTTVTVKDSNGNITSKTEQKVDDNGNILEFKYYSNDGEVAYWYKSTYNDKSQEIERKMLAGDKDAIYTYQYDAFDPKDNWTKQIIYKNGQLETLIIREIEY